MVEYHILVEKSYTPSVPRNISYWFENKQDDNEGIRFYNKKARDDSFYYVQIVPQKARKKLVVKVPHSMIDEDMIIESLMEKKWFKVLKIIAYEEGKRFVLHTTDEKLESDLFGVERILNIGGEKERVQEVREIIYAGVKTLAGIDSVTYDDERLKVHGIFKFRMPIGKTKRLFLTLIIVYTIVISLDELKDNLNEKEVNWIIKSSNSIMKNMEKESPTDVGIVKHFDKISGDGMIVESVKVSVNHIIEYKLIREIGALLVASNIV